MDGKNFYPQDIEFLAQKTHPFLKSNHGVAVSTLGSPELAGGIYLVQEIVQGAESDLESADLSQLKQRIRETVYSILGLSLTEVLLVSARTIPQTTSGKLRRNTVKQALLKGLITDVTEHSYDVETI